jgi:hypothetical protein
MAKGKAKGRELSNDYLMLGRMSRELAEHRKRINAIEKRVARNKIRLDLKEGVLENLEIVSSQMEKAQKELDKARKRLKLI